MGFSLRPISASLKVGASLTVQLESCDSVEVDEDLATLLGKCDPADASGLSGWSVNGVAGGNGTVGTIVAQGAVAIYTAPGMKPTANPVRISVEVPSGAGRTILFSNVQITDGRVSGAPVFFTADDRPDVVL
jgi:hypothetical protein